MNAKVAGCLLPLFLLFAIAFPAFWWPVFSACALTGWLCLFCRSQIGKAREMERMRTRLASDLHDDIGASLSQLAVLGEVLHRKLGATDPQITTTLASMRRISGEAVDAMSDIVWTTNPQLDSLANLVRRMRRFASEMLPAAGIEFSFQAPPSALDVPLEAELRRQVFLIFKESINNAARHSGATHTAIELRLARTELALQIRDNGHGFDPTVAAEGNGLKSLHRRAQSLGARFRIDSSGRGTTVVLCVPYQPAAWQSSGQCVLAWLQKIPAHFRFLLTRANTYLNRGVTGLPRHSTLRPSTIQKSPK